MSVALVLHCSCRYAANMAVVIQGYIKFVAGGSKTPWQATLAPTQGGDNSKLYLGLFASVSDAEKPIEAKIGRKLQWVLQPTADQVPLYVGTSS